MLDEIKPVLRPGILDSGAYSVATGFWSELPIDDYINFVNKHHKRFKLIASPDVIGDTQKTLENFKYFIERVTIPREKILSVYHSKARELNRFNEVVDYSQEAGLSYIAIGGAIGVGFTPTDKIVLLEALYEVLEKRGNPLKTHLFGMADPQTIKLFKPNSVDSSAATQKAMFLREHRANLETWRFIGDNIDKKHFSRERILSKLTERFLTHAERLLPYDKDSGDYEYVYRNLERSPDGVNFLALNSLNMVELEEHTRKTFDYDFRYYMTITSGFITSYSGYMRTAFEYAWRDRTLTTYATLRGLKGKKLHNELQLYGENL